MMRILALTAGIFGLLMLWSADAQEPRKKVAVGKSVTLEIDGDQRRVLVNAYVCLREGLLEQLVTRKRTKEHEAPVATDADGREIHLALTLAGAEPGSPVKFRPKFEPPRGTEIKVTFEYLDNGKQVAVPAQQWVRNAKTRKAFEGTWVFGGSFLIPDPLDKNKQPFYAANDGNLICLANFEDGMLDVPFVSTRENDDLVFEAWTERIPALKTPVTIILEPVRAKK